MYEAGQLRLKNSAIACIIFGTLRLLSFMHQSMLFPEIERMPAFYVLLIASSVWQLYIGILGLVYWEEIEDVSIVPHISRSVIILALLDGAFIILGMFLFLLRFSWPLLYALILFGYPAVVFYVEAANGIKKYVIRHSKNVCEKSFQKGKSKQINVLKVIVNSATVFMSGILLMIVVNFMQPNIPLEKAIPWGTWESENPPIVLYINPDYRMIGWGYFTYPALYKMDNEEIRILVNFGTQPGRIGQYRPHVMYITGGHNREPSWRSRGDGFEVIDGTLHVTTNTQDLIFRPAETYLPIDISEWR